MEVKVVEHAGFCNGVKRAFDTALAQERGTKVLGQLVHNPDVDQILDILGVTEQEILEVLPRKDEGDESYRTTVKKIKEAVGLFTVRLEDSVGLADIS